MPYQSLINLYLRDCAQSNKDLKIEIGQAHESVLNRTGSQQASDKTVAALIALGRELMEPVDPAKIQEQLKGSDLNDRLDSALFTMSHLFYSGAIAEQHSM